MKNRMRQIEIDAFELKIHFSRNEKKKTAIRAERSERTLERARTDWIDANRIKIQSRHSCRFPENRFALSAFEIAFRSRRKELLQQKQQKQQLRWELLMGPNAQRSLCRWMDERCTAKEIEARWTDGRNDWFVNAKTIHKWQTGFKTYAMQTIRKRIINLFDSFHSLFSLWPRPFFLCFFRFNFSFFLSLSLSVSHALFLVDFNRLFSPLLLLLHQLFHSSVLFFRWTKLLSFF